MSRNRLPARRPIPCVVERDLNEPATPMRDGTWVEAAIAYHAAAAGDIAKCIADEGAFAVGQTLVEHGLIRQYLRGNDLDQLHAVITDIATRLLRERIIRRMGAIQENPDSARNVTRRDLVITLLTGDDE